MTAIIRVVIISDGEEDLSVLLKELASAGYQSEAVSVRSESAFELCLESKPDLILADSDSKGLTPCRAIEILWERERDVPLIALGRTTDEGQIVSAIKCGAADYVSRSHLARLGPVAREAIAACAARRFQSERNELRRIGEDRFRTVFERSNDAIFLIDVQGEKILDANPKACAMLGYARDEFFCMPVSAVHPHEMPKLRAFAQSVSQNGYGRTEELSCLTKSGRSIPAEISASIAAETSGGSFLIAMVRDNEERKRAEAERQVLFEIVSNFDKAATLQEALLLSHYSLRQVLAAENCAVAVRQRTGQYVFPGFLDEYESVPTHEQTVRSCIDYVYRTGRPMLLTDEDLRRLEASGEIDPAGRRPLCWLGAPLRAPREILGVIALKDYKKRDAYLPRDLDFLVSVASQLALSIERKQAAEELKKLSCAVEETADLVMMTDFEGSIEYVNKAFESQTGYSRDEVFGKNPRFLKSGVQPPEFYEEIWKTIRAGKVFHGEFVNRKKDGTLYSEEKTITPIGDRLGKFTHFVATGKDISERKRSEQALHRRAMQQAAVAELGQAALAGVGLSLLIEEAAALVTRTLDLAYCGVVEYLPETKTFRTRAVAIEGEANISAPDDREVLDPQASFTLLSGGPVIVPNLASESRFNAAPLPYPQAKSGVSVIISGEQHPFGVMSAYGSKSCCFEQDDVHFLQSIANVLATAIERKKAEEKTLLQKSYFQQLFENAPVGLVMVDDRECIVDFNKSFGSLFKLSRDQVSGKEINSVVAPGDLALEAQQLSQAVLSGQSIAKESLRIRSDGKAVPVQIYGVPIEVDRKHVGGYGMYVDLTDRKQLEMQLLQAQKMEAVGRLAGGVAHDFNNLLTAITGYSELLLGEFPADSPYREELEEIKKAGERAASLTRQLLAFSRKQVLQPRVIDLAPLVSNLEKMLRRLIGEDVRVTIEIAPKLGRIMADPGQIEQVIINLAVNARDAMPNGGRLTIRAENVRMEDVATRPLAAVPSGPQVLLSVSDSGCGMDEETLSHIFEPFFTTKEHGRGTGLGLSTVYGIVNQSGGQITVESHIENGTTFRIYFPQVLDECEEMRHDYSRSVPGGSETVLVVEDDAQLRRLACSVLEQNGYCVLQADGGEQALEICLQGRRKIDLLLTDVVMRGMSGGELAALLTKLYPDLKVIYMSGYPDQSIMERGVLTQGITYLQKPFALDCLLKKVRYVFDGGLPGAEKANSNSPLAAPPG